MLRTAGRGQQSGWTGGSPKGGETDSGLPDLQKLSTHSIVVSLNRIFRLNYGRKSATKESLPAPDARPPPDPTHPPSKTTKTEHPIDAYPARHNQSRTSHLRTKIAKRPTLKHKRLPFGPNQQQLSPNRTQNTILSRNPKTCSKDSHTSHGLYAGDEQPSNRVEHLQARDRRGQRGENHSQESDSSFLESKSRKISIQAKLAPLSLMHSYEEEPHELVDLINKFKFENLKTSHLPSDPSKQSLKGRAANLSLSRRNRKPDPAFFEEEDGERRRGNKTVSRVFYRANSREKLTFYEQVDSAMARGKKGKNGSNNNYLSPWATVKVENFSLLE